MRMSVPNNKGFSLVELMVVVAIIGILAAIAVPNFQRFAQKSKQAEAKANLSALYSSMSAYRSEWNVYRGNFSQNGYAPTGRLNYRHGFTADGAAAVPGEPAPVAGVGFDTVTYCATTALGTPRYCVHHATPVNQAGATMPAAAAAAGTFVAGAAGNISGVAADPWDTWTIDQSKTFTNTINGLR